MTSTVSLIEEDYSPISKHSLVNQQQPNQTFHHQSNITSNSVIATATTTIAAASASASSPSSILIDQEHLRPFPKFLQSLYRASTPQEKEKIIFKFACTLDYIFYDIPPTQPSSREGNAMERDIQALLEACFSVLQIAVTDETYVVEPPARFAALRALGAFVQGSAPIPTILSQDWKQPHVPLYLAVMKLLTHLFERGSTQYVFAIRCLSVLAIQALQIISPQNPVDCAVSAILSSPSRSSATHHQHQQQNQQHEQQNHDDSALITHSSPTNAVASDAIMNASTASPSKRATINNNGPTKGSPLRLIPQLHPAKSASSMLFNGGKDGVDDDIDIHVEQGKDQNQNGTSPNTLAYQRLLMRRIPGETGDDSSFVDFEALYMDHLLQDPILRPLVLDLWKLWDGAGIDVRVFTACPENIHVYLPTRLLSSVGCVYRDFITCPERPKMEKPWSGNCEIHLKTNIAIHSNVMYRILIEGYNYGVNSPIQSELVGAAKRHWDTPGGGSDEQLEKMCRDYASGCSSTQYFSTDGYLVIKLVSKSFFGVGFTASAWMIFHGHQPGFPIEGEVFHQEEDL